jgi:hypothetical protein
MATKLRCPKVAILGALNAQDRASVQERLSDFGVLFFEVRRSGRRNRRGG